MSQLTNSKPKKWSKNCQLMWLLIHPLAKNLKSLLLLRIGCKKLWVLCKLEINQAPFVFNELQKLRRNSFISCSNGNRAIRADRSFLKKRRYLHRGFRGCRTCLLPVWRNRGDDIGFLAVWRSIKNRPTLQWRCMRCLLYTSPSPRD